VKGMDELVKGKAGMDDMEKRSKRDNVLFSDGKGRKLMIW
jgi:hypothetical protein